MREGRARAGGRIGFAPNPGTLLIAARAAFLVALAAAILLTPGFFLPANILSLLTAVSFIGCASVGMTLITISGNLLSFSLGITVAASAMVFVAAVNFGGTAFAIAATLAFGVLLTGLQGFVIGYFRSHPIIVSIAVLALISGLSDPITGNESFSIAPDAMPHGLTGTLFGIPMEFIIFAGVIAIGQSLLSFTGFGRSLYMIGSSMRAAESAGIDICRTITVSYALTGLFTALAGILLAAHYQMADMEYGHGYDYDAIAAVLVGGTAIRGGQGSILRTLAGVMVVAVVQSILLLQGWRPEWQYLITGTIVLAVIMLHMNAGKR
jgi:ribose/xylose/arabinose/galactoside ABC-type transport system permease subunit